MKERRNQVFLINNEWIENFKSFFEYKDLEISLVTLFENFNNLNKNDEIFNNVISKLPSLYFEKMIGKLIDNNGFNEINKKAEDISYNVKKEKIEENEINLNFMSNFQIINPKINELLNEIKINMNSIKVNNSLIFGFSI